MCCLLECELTEVQLAAAYIATLALPHTNFSVVSHGLRLAQDLGAHRRMTYGKTPTLENEQRKRAFWYVPTYIHNGVKPK